MTAPDSGPREIAVIPCRRGSRRIPRKSLRDIDGRPLFLHAAEATIAAGFDTYVSTDDEEVATIARYHGIRVIARPPGLAEDDVPVAEVAKHAFGETGAEVVLLAQPTCPLISPQTYREAVEMVRQDSCLGKVSFVAPVRRLHYTDSSTEYIEPGAITVGAGCYVFREGWFETGEDDYYADVYIIPRGEFSDIDLHQDLNGARLDIERGQVAFRIVANGEKGAGHLYRCISLATELSHHDVYFLMRECDDWAWAMVQEAGFDAYKDKDEGFGPDCVLVNDALDTGVEDVLPGKLEGARVVCLEDFGAGSDYADLVIQELYEDGRGNAVCGPEWAVMRPEFRYAPERETRELAQRVLVTFGGVDPAHLTERVARTLYPLSHGEEIKVIKPPARELEIGLGFPGLVQGPFSMAEEMRAADVVVCSAGRTAFEAARVGTPVVSISANAREETHVHCPGVLRMGLYVSVSDNDIRSTVERLLGSYELRREMSMRGQAAVDGKGSGRIAWEVERLMRGL